LAHGGLGAVFESSSFPLSPPEIGILLPNHQRQHRTLNVQKDVLPYALR